MIALEKKFGWRYDGITLKGNTMQKNFVRLALWTGLLLVVASCAGRQPLVTIEPSKGETTIDMKADNFKFQPNNIKAYQGDVLILRIENISKTEHNFTIEDPQGRALQSVPLPAGKTTSVKIPLSARGTYEFYCDKPFHSAFGMKGWIKVDENP